LFNHGEAQPTSGAIDDGFPAAADKFQRAISSLFLYFRPGRDDLRGQFVKFGNVVHAQIIVAIYFDYLPLGSSKGDCRSEGQGSEGKRENRPTLHWEGHVCAIVSKTASISRNDDFQVSKVFRTAPPPLNALGRQANCLCALKSRLTCGFFALNTGNVFFQSARYPRSDRIIPRGNSDAARDGRISARQKISEMLCLARDQREGAILSRGVDSRAEQKGLSTAPAL